MFDKERCFPAWGNIFWNKINKLFSNIKYFVIIDTENLRELCLGKVFARKMAETPPAYNVKVH